MVSILNNAPKGILKNKYFLYFLFFICILAIGFFVNVQKYDYIILFLLVGLLARCYHGNMVIVLLAALSVTFVYMILQRKSSSREGLENATPTTGGAAAAVASPPGAALPAAAATTVATDKTGGTAKVTTSDVQTKVSAPTNTTLQSTDLNTNKATETFTPGTQQKGSKVNYAATVQDAYQNLESLVGGDGLNQLTEQTSTLLGQQTKLVDTMKNLTPLMNQVRGLISTFEKASPTNLANPANFVNA